MSLTALLFLMGFGAGVVLSFVRHPFWGLAAYVAVYYLDAPSRWWGESLPGLRWALLIALCTLLSVLIHKRAERQNWLKQGPIWVVIVYLAWMIVQSLWAVSGEDHTNGVVTFSKYIVVLFLVYTIVDTKERLVDFMLVHVIGCFYLALLAYFSYTGGRLDGIGGPGISDANSLGMQMGTAAMCAAAIYFARSDWRKWVAAASLPFILNAIVMSGSRGAFLALLVGGFGLVYLRPAGQTARLGVYAVAGLAMLLYLASDLFIERIATIGEVTQEQPEEVDQSVATRLELFRKQWEMAKDYPLGAGHKGTAALSVSYLSEEHMSNEGGRSSHNTLMSALVDQGFLGAFLWLLLMWLLFRRLQRVNKAFDAAEDRLGGWLAAGLFGAVVVYWAAGMFAPLFRAEIYMWLIAAICASETLVQSEARETPATPVRRRTSGTI